MYKLALANLMVVATVASASRTVAQTPAAPAPVKEHEWLQQLVGEWTIGAEAIAAPGDKPASLEGRESVRSLGGIWTVSEATLDVHGAPMKSVMTLGYDPQKKKYVGTWVDSMTNFMWHYEGTVDATGKILTLDTEGPNMMAPGTTAKFKETIEIKDKDHKEMSSSMLGPDGKWFTFVTVKYERRAK